MQLKDMLELLLLQILDIKMTAGVFLEKNQPHKSYFLLSKLYITLLANQYSIMSAHPFIAI